MIRKSLGSRARQLVGGLALGAFAIAAQADPISVQGICRLSSIIVGQGRCELSFFISDGFVTPANIKSAVVRVDNIVVQRYLNDGVNPVLQSVPYNSGGTAVSCGASHTVIVFITRLGVGTVPVQVGSFPSAGVLCPVAP